MPNYRLDRDVFVSYNFIRLFTFQEMLQIWFHCLPMGIGTETPGCLWYVQVRCFSLNKIRFLVLDCITKQYFHRTNSTLSGQWPWLPFHLLVWKQESATCKWLRVAARKAAQGVWQGGCPSCFCASALQSKLQDKSSIWAYVFVHILSLWEQDPSLNTGFIHFM